MKQKKKINRPKKNIIDNWFKCILKKYLERKLFKIFLSTKSEYVLNKVRFINNVHPDCNFRKLRSMIYDNFKIDVINAEFYNLVDKQYHRYKNVENQKILNVLKNSKWIVINQ